MRARSQQRSGQFQARLPISSASPARDTKYGVGLSTRRVSSRSAKPSSAAASSACGCRPCGRYSTFIWVRRVTVSRGRPAASAVACGDLVDVQPVQRFAIPCLGLAGSQQAQAALASRLQAEYGRQRQERSQRGIRFAVEGTVIDPRLHQHRVGILVDQQQRGLALALHEHQAGALRGHSGLARRREAKHGQQRERAPTGHG